MGGVSLRSHTKRWPSVFSEDRDYKGNRPYVEEIRGIIGEDGDEIGILLEDVEGEIPTCKIEELKSFCQGASLKDLISGTSPETRREDAWLDERIFSRSSARGCKNPASATKLLALLEGSVRKNYIFFILAKTPKLTKLVLGSWQRKYDRSRQTSHVRTATTFLFMID